MKTAVMKIKDIHPAAYNPRVTLEPGDTEYEALKNSMEKFGVASPLIVNGRTGNLISGHQRLNILIEQGAEETEVVLTDMDEQQEKLCNIALNKIDGDWDYTKLQELFEEFEEECPDDIKYTGFTEQEVRDLFGLFDEEMDGLQDDEAQSGEKQDQEQKEKEFSIFLSFATKELAEKWIAEKGIDAEYKGTARNITVRMEGLEYGKGY